MVIITHVDRDVVVKNSFHVVLQSVLGVSSNPIICSKIPVHMASKHVTLWLHRLGIIG